MTQKKNAEPVQFSRHRTAGENELRFAQLVIQKAPEIIFQGKQQFRLGNVRTLVDQSFTYDGRQSSWKSTPVTQLAHGRLNALPEFHSSTARTRSSDDYMDYLQVVQDFVRIPPGSTFGETQQGTNQTADLSD